MKGMVSTVRRSCTRPRWITKTLWKQLNNLWKTDMAKKRSKTASTARNSPRNGPDPHTSLYGQKSYQHIQDEMEIELDRPITLTEVFMRTDTRADGSFVDLKVQEVGKTYEIILKAKLSEAEVELFETQDGTTPAPTLTIDEKNSSTTVDVRGNHFVLGSLNKTHVNGKKKKYSSTASAFVALQEQLQVALRHIDEQAALRQIDEQSALRQIDEQAAENARRDAEFARREAENQAKMSLFDVFASYMHQKDSDFMDYMAAHSLHTLNAPTSNSGPQ